MVCGGGSCNLLFMVCLVVLLSGIEVIIIDVVGISGDDMEVLVFVWFVWWMLVGLSGNLFFVIGVSQEMVLGVIFFVNL